MLRKRIAVNPTRYDKATRCQNLKCEIKGLFGPHIHTKDLKNA
jgi:hypothetical protein